MFLCGNTDFKSDNLLRLGTPSAVTQFITVKTFSYYGIYQSQWPAYYGIYQSQWPAYDGIFKSHWPYVVSMLIAGAFSIVWSQSLCGHSQPVV